MLKTSRLLGAAGVLSIFVASCGGGDSDGASDGGAASGNAGAAGAGTGGAGTGGMGTGGMGTGGTPGMCIPHDDYSRTFYYRLVLDDGLITALASIAASPDCGKLDFMIDSAASTVATVAENHPPDGQGTQTFMGTLPDGEDLVFAFATQELGLVDITIGCDGTTTATLGSGPLAVNCSGMLLPTGGSLQCEVLGPAGPLGLATITITTDAPDPASCTPPPPPLPAPDCAADLPLSPAVGGACTAGCQLAQGGGCSQGQCRALCVDSQVGCSLHCQPNESCLPLEQGGNRVTIDIGGTDYPAGACALETGPRQAYETCGALRCDGFNCLGFAGVNGVGLCAPECFGDDSDCPPGPAGFTSICRLTDGSFRTFCALTCDPTRPTETCPPDFSCAPAGVNPMIPGINMPTRPVCLPVRP